MTHAEAREARQGAASASCVGPERATAGGRGRLCSVGQGMQRTSGKCTHFGAIWTRTGTHAYASIAAHTYTYSYATKCTCKNTFTVNLLIHSFLFLSPVLRPLPSSSLPPHHQPTIGSVKSRGHEARRQHQGLPPLWKRPRD